MTKTVGDVKLQRAGGWCEPVTDVSEPLTSELGVRKPVGE